MHRYDTGCYILDTPYRQKHYMEAGNKDSEKLYKLDARMKKKFLKSLRPLKGRTWNLLSPSRMSDIL